MMHTPDPSPELHAANISAHTETGAATDTSESVSAGVSIGVWQRLRKIVRGMFAAPITPEWQEIYNEHHDNGNGNGHSTITAHERGIITAALKLDEMTAEEICVPRSDIIAIRTIANLPEIMQVFQEHRKSRLLVIGEDLDDVQGFITLKDVLPSVAQHAHQGARSVNGFSLKPLVRSATFVPTTQPLDRVLQIMKKNRSPLAVVVDEYGGTAGLVTLKDILQVLVGDLADEDDDAVDYTAPHPLGNGAFKLDPLMPLPAVYKLFRLPPPPTQPGAETIGGLVLEHCGAVPKTGESIHWQGLTLQVTDANQRRILALEVKAHP